MAKDPGPFMPLGPSTIPVHDHGDVPWQFVLINL